MADRRYTPDELNEMANDAELRALGAGADGQEALNIGNAVYLLRGMGVEPEPDPLNPFGGDSDV